MHPMGRLVSQGEEGRAEMRCSDSLPEFTLRGQWGSCHPVSLLTNVYNLMQWIFSQSTSMQVNCVTSKAVYVPFQTPWPRFWALVSGLGAVGGLLASTPTLSSACR